ncbi:MAG TPA: response regulator [Bryobacteraceae bacterium]|nr:response regulator [Bryobacteraceae bacterium]
MKPYRILVVEDNPADVELVQMALEQHKVPAQLEVVRDGEAAIERLQRTSPETAGIDLLLLDLNLPRHNGLTVLEKFRAQPHRACTPVIIMTSAESSTLPQLAQWLGANLYFRKPINLDEFMQLGFLVRHVLQPLGDTESQRSS